MYILWILMKYQKNILNFFLEYLYVIIYKELYFKVLRT